jgi:hypothetical protein
MPQDVLDNMAGLVENMPNLAAVMQNTFHVALSISPLLILHPKKLNADSIRRDLLIAVGLHCHSTILRLLMYIWQHSVSMGNIKPKRLIETENTIWYSLFSMAAGADHATEIANLLAKLPGNDVLDENDKQIQVDDVSPMAKIHGDGDVPMQADDEDKDPDFLGEDGESEKNGSDTGSEEERGDGDDTGKKSRRSDADDTDEISGPEGSGAVLPQVGLLHYLVTTY